MQLTSEELKTYDLQGYLLLPNCFAPGEVEVMRTEPVLCVSKIWKVKFLKKTEKLSE